MRAGTAAKPLARAREAQTSLRFDDLRLHPLASRKIGYARVSTSSQNLDRQIAALRAADCEVIFREKASGKDTKGRPQLEKAIDELGTGDVLGVAEWDRVTRSMLDGVAIIERIHARGCFVKVLDKPHLISRRLSAADSSPCSAPWRKTNGSAL